MGSYRSFDIKLSNVLDPLLEPLGLRCPGALRLTIERIEPDGKWEGEVWWTVDHTSVSSDPDLATTLAHRLSNITLICRHHNQLMRDLFVVGKGEFLVCPKDGATQPYPDTWPWQQAILEAIGLVP